MKRDNVTTTPNPLAGAEQTTQDADPLDIIGLLVDRIASLSAEVERGKMARVELAVSRVKLREELEKERAERISLEAVRAKLKEEIEFLQQSVRQEIANRNNLADELAVEREAANNVERRRKTTQDQRDEYKILDDEFRKIAGYMSRRGDIRVGALVSEATITLIENLERQLAEARKEAPHEQADVKPNSRYPMASSYPQDDLVKFKCPSCSQTIVFHKNNPALGLHVACKNCGAYMHRQ